MPGNAPEDPESNERVVENWQDLEKLAEGQLSLKVTDENGNFKKEVRHARVSGPGSKEYISEKNGNGPPAWIEKDLPDQGGN